MRRTNRRILFCMPTAAGIGGVETWVDNVVPYLSARGWDIVVGLARGLTYNRPDVYQALHPGLPTVVIDGRGLDRAGREFALRRCLRRTSPAIFAPLGLHDAYNAFFEWKTKHSQAKLVLRNQGLLPPLLAELQRFGPHADLVVSDSRLVTRLAREYPNIVDHRVRHLPNGAVPSRWKRNAQEHTSSIRLGYVGRFTQSDKRVLDLVDLCEELHRRRIPCTVDVVGDGPRGDELRARLQTERLVSMVRFHGRLTSERIHQSIYPNLDALLLFSASESFGIVLVEAMMNGVVPITSQYLGFHSEALVQQNKTGLSFPVGDIQAAARSVQRLAADRSLLNRLAKAAHAHVSTAYTWERCLRSWHEALSWTLTAEPMATRPVAGIPRQMSGVLDRLGLPPVQVDLLRRIRRAMFGPAAAPGGEEWPLSGRTYSQRTLDEITERCCELEAASDQYTAPRGETV